MIDVTSADLDLNYLSHSLEGFRERGRERERERKEVEGAREYLIIRRTAKKLHIQLTIGFGIR